MDYVEMIKDPELVLGFQELISDSDPVVVKRTVKVFTSVYYHTLRLLSSGELEEETLMKSWTPVKGVVDTLLGMVKRCDNEGILIHLLRFLEAAVMSHLMYDLSSFPFIFERGREVVKTGLKALKDLVTTPYVGGSPFIVGVRALISIACLRPDLWAPVTDLLKKQLTSLPPTLFDHNVRSLNKTLQRNLFRLLRRAETNELKEKLIEMMVSVGVPRKMIMPWAPSLIEGKKRVSPGTFSDDFYPGRVTPPDKKSRLNGEGNRNEKNLISSRSDTPEVPTDPRLAPPQDPRKVPQQNIINLENTVSFNKANNADLMFLTSLIPTGKSTETVQKEESSNLENELYEELDLNRVCSLVIQNIDDVPDKEPPGFITAIVSQGKITEDIKTMRKNLATLFGRYLAEHNIKSVSQSTDSKSNSPLPTAELSAEDSSQANSKGMETIKVNSNCSSASSTPSSTPPLMDTDLRQVYPRSSIPMGDVDMRIADPRLAARDPRMLKDPRIRKEIADPRLSHSEPRETRIDPRLDNRVAEPKPRLDPRMPNSNLTKKNSEPRKSRWDPRTPEIDTNSSPPLGMVSQSPRNATEVPSSRSNDPRINRPLPQGQGLLPHPDPRTFQQETVDPRMQLQTQGGDPRMQQSFNTQPPFPFGHMNPLNQFNSHFMGGLSLPPSSMPPPMLNGSSFSWQNSLRNPPPHLLIAQTLASVQSGMMPPTMINL